MYPSAGDIRHVPVGAGAGTVTSLFVRVVCFGRKAGVFILYLIVLVSSVGTFYGLHAVSVFFVPGLRCEGGAAQDLLSHRGQTRAGSLGECSKGCFSPGLTPEALCVVCAEGNPCIELTFRAASQGLSLHPSSVIPGTSLFLCVCS